VKPEDVKKQWSEEIREIILGEVRESQLRHNNWMDNGDKEYELNRWIPLMLKSRSTYSKQIPGTYHQHEVSWNEREIWVRVDFILEGDLQTVEVTHNFQTQFTNTRQGNLFANHKQPKLI